MAVMTVLIVICLSIFENILKKEKCVTSGIVYETISNMLIPWNC